MTNYDEVPQFLWYRAYRHTHGHYRTYWVNGKEYISFDEEPTYEEIQRYDLRFLGVGDMSDIGRTIK